MKAVPRSLKGNIILYLKGWGMGIADLIPGISGGTLALVFGIYEELLEAIKSITPSNLKFILRGQWRQAGTAMFLPFLAVLLGGIASSVVVLSNGIKWLLENHPEQLYGFFFGLILVTVPLICRVVRQWSPGKIAGFLFTAGLAWKIVQLVPVQTPDNYFFIFMSGAIAICAMILPGISGSFILLILGKYYTVLEAIHDRNIVLLFVFILGITVGILSFARVVSWALSKAHDWVIACLAGFVLGSLHKIWPWKQTLEFVLNRHGQPIPLIEQNILPLWSGSTILTLCLILTGVVVAIAFGCIPEKSK